MGSGGEFGFGNKHLELTRGEVADRPWGQTLGALGVRQLTGQLTLRASDDKEYCVAFERGAVVGATSPLVTDSAARVALTNHLITASQISQIAHVVAAHPDRDELEVVAKACGLDTDRALRLRQRVIAQRAARTFSVESGTFVVHDVVTIPTAAAAAVDIRAVVYLGARMNLSEQRLAADLRKLGTHFVLKTGAIEELRKFGLTSVERPILEALHGGTTLPEFEAKHRDVDPRSVQTVVYSLVSCFACDATQPDAPGQAAVPFKPVAPRPSASAVDGIVIKPSPRVPPDARVARTSTPPATSSRTRTPSKDPDVTIAPPRTIQSRTETPIDRPIMHGSRTSSDEVTNPGTNTPPTVAPAPPRTSPPPTNPPRPAVPLVSTRPAATRPPTRPSSPSLPTRKSEPLLPTQARAPTPSSMFPHAPTPGPSVARVSSPSFSLEEPSGSDRVVDPLATAAEAYQRGQAALRKDEIQLAIDELTRAAELNPHDFEYHATLAWAQFCGATDKTKIADKVRKMLGHAIQKSLHPELPRFYLGRMERMLGRDREALRHFQELLETQPRNAEVATEIRMIETRLASGSAEKPGLGSLFGRKKP